MTMSCCAAAADRATAPGSSRGPGGRADEPGTDESGAASQRQIEILETKESANEVREARPGFDRCGCARRRASSAAASSARVTGRRTMALRSQRSTRRRGKAPGIQPMSATRLSANERTSRRARRDRAPTGRERRRGRCESQQNVRSADSRPTSAGISVSELRSILSVSRVDIENSEPGNERR